MISIVVPCYNNEKYVRGCIEKLIHQTHRELEIVLVDDGSRDKTGELFDEYAAKDDRIKVIHQDNKGLLCAWKTGVSHARGTYIAFCDSDDYYDDDLIEKLLPKLHEYQPDILLYGIKTEYEDGRYELCDNRLAEGFYNRSRIEESILPTLLSDGTMESTLILPSRFSKIFRREFLVTVFDVLDERVTNGEDKLTMFASVLLADSIYCTKNFYPYHYIRNDESMIGKYDPNRFSKLQILQEAMLHVADRYGYDKRKVEETYLSDLMICLKKEICRNPKGYKESRKQLQRMWEHEYTQSAFLSCDCRRYKPMGKVFFWLFKNHRFRGLYVITKCASAMGAGRA